MQPASHTAANASREVQKGVRFLSHTNTRTYICKSHRPSCAFAGEKLKVCQLNIPTKFHNLLASVLLLLLTFLWFAFCAVSFFVWLPKAKAKVQANFPKTSQRKVDKNNNKNKNKSNAAMCNKPESNNDNDNNNNKETELFKMHTNQMSKSHICISTCASVACTLHIYMCVCVCIGSAWA